MESSDLGYYRILYIGLDPKTISILDRLPLKVVATSQLDFFNTFTPNPKSILFKIVYFLHKQKKASTIKFFLYRIWKSLPIKSHGVYSRYGKYLEVVVESNIEIINTENSDLTLEYIQKNKVDLSVVNLWSLIPTEIANAPRLGTLNIHPSALPKYKGALPTLWSLKNKDNISAVTYLLVSNSIDGGDIISQYPFNIPMNTSALDMENIIGNIVEKTLFADTVGYIKGDKTPTKQVGESSGTEKYLKYLKINWQSESSEEIANKVMLYPYLEPNLYCHCNYNSKKIEIRNITNIMSTYSLEPGTFIIKKMKVQIGTCDGKDIQVILMKDVSIKDSLKLLFGKSRKFE